MTNQSKTSLQRLKDTYKTKNGKILPAVQRMLLKSAGDSDRDTEHIHPSEVAKSDWCPRRAWLRISGAEPNKKKSNASSKMEMIFEEGHNIHHKWQKWMRYADGLDLIGRWKCDRCGEDWFGEDKSYCPLCMDSAISYREVPFNVVDGGYRVIGHADGLVRTEDGNVLIEIKSIGVGTLRFEAPSLAEAYQNGMSVADVWMEIKSPFPSHLRQGMLYLWLTQLQYADEYVADEIVFIYEFKATQDVKEFSVKYNEAIIADRIADIIYVTDALDMGEEVDHPEWSLESREDSPHCSGCEFRDACWGIEDKQEKSSDSVNDSPKTRVRKTSSTRKRSRVRQT